MKRWGFLAVFAGLLSLAWWTIPGQAQPGTVKQIVPGVWFREGEMSGMGHCNNVIIEMKDYLLVVDANFPSGAALALADARKLSPKPVRYVFDTHHHGDHLYGNPIWTKAGAKTLAYAGVLEELKRYEPARWLDTAKQRKDVGDLQLPAPEAPMETFTKSPHIIDDGTRRVEIYFFGWAHTRGDGFVYLPKEQVLCTGDAVVNGPHNNLADANIGNWPSVIGKAQQLKVKYVLPGHGGPSGPELLAGQKQFFTELYAATKKAQKAGQTVEQASASVTLSPAVQNWAGSALKDRVKVTYEEIAGGKPHGDLPH